MQNEVLYAPSSEWCQNCGHEVTVFTTGGVCPVCSAPLPACNMCVMEGCSECLCGSNFKYHENCEFSRHPKDEYKVWAEGGTVESGPFTYEEARRVALELEEAGSHNVVIDRTSNGGAEDCTVV